LKNWLRTSFWKQLLGKYTSPELDPDPDLAVKIPDPEKNPDFTGSGSPTLLKGLGVVVFGPGPCIVKNPSNAIVMPAVLATVLS
jgi:hypothetical protein